MSEKLTISPEEEKTDRLNKAALDHDIELSEHRLKRLIEVADNLKNGRGFYDPKIGFHIDPGTEPSIDFAPERIAYPSPEQATLFAHYGIRGIQDYTLLVEAGFIERPDRINGKTNPQMAKVAERLGFKEYDGEDDLRKTDIYGKMKMIYWNKMTRGKIGDPWEDQVSVTAPFDTIEERVFSDEIKHLDEVLVKRLASEKLGKTALSNDADK